MSRAADYLQAWCDGSWIPLPLLDVSENLAFNLCKVSCSKLNGTVAFDFDPAIGISDVLGSHKQLHFHAI